MRVRGTTTTTTTTYRPPTSRPQPFQQPQAPKASPAIQPPSPHFSAPAFDYKKVSVTTTTTTKPIITNVAPLKIVVDDYKPEQKQQFFTNPTQSLHRQTIGNNGILPLTTTTTERIRKDPFKTTYDTKFLNKQDAFNYQLNQEFQPNRQQPASTTTTTTSTSTTTQSPSTFNRNPPTDGLRLNQNQFNHFAQQQQLAGQHKTASESARGISFAQSQQQENIRFNPNQYSADTTPTKLQQDNFNNLERTVQQLQKSVNKAFPTLGNKESRTLLSSFALSPQPTTFNPSQYSRATQAPFISSSPRGFAATAATFHTNATNQNGNKVFEEPRKLNKEHIPTITLNSNSKFTPRSNENYTPSSVKRFSTLVPRDNYNPTTFKPVEGFAVAQFQQQLQSQNSRYLNSLTFSQPPLTSTTSTTTTSTTTTTTKAPTTFVPRTNAPVPVTTQLPRLIATTQRPLPITTAVAPTNFADIDEDDGQYHPELYEQDFAKNKLKRLRQQNENQKISSANQFNNNNFNNNNNNRNNFQQFQPQSNNNNYNNNNNNNNHFNSASPVPQSFSNSVTNSGEDEFLHTAHSQNIAASQNELRQQNAAKAAAKSRTNNNHHHQHQNQSNSSKTLSKAPTIPPNATSTRKPTTKADDKDASYDYAYYDSANENVHVNDYSEYGIITDFGKTKKQ